MAPKSRVLREPAKPTVPRVRRAEVRTAVAGKRPAPGAKKKTAPRSVTERHCSVSRTVSIIGDGWSFMILRECYFGVRRFQHFQEMLGLPRATLTARLRTFTEEGVLRRVQYQERPARFEYRLSKLGFDLYGVMIAMLVFGDRWLGSEAPLPLELFHVPCGKATNPVVSCSECRRPLTAGDTIYRPGPGAGSSRIEAGPQSRRSADPTALERRRPSSVARTLKIIGDRWSFMVMREAFYGARRYDEFQDRLGIATNILADRVNRFVRLGLFTKVRYQSAPDRYEYRLTEMGQDLHGPFLMMMAWGDQWLSTGGAPVLLEHRTCGRTFRPSLICSECGEAIVASDMQCVPSYPLPPNLPPSTHVRTGAGR